eukprot:1161948-Pelagomonas_calceolata.AAC.5
MSASIAHVVCDSGCWGTTPGQSSSVAPSLAQVKGSECCAVYTGKMRGARKRHDKGEKDQGKCWRFAYDSRSSHERHFTERQLPRKGSAAALSPAELTKNLGVE